MKLFTHISNAAKLIGISDELVEEKHLSNLLNAIGISTFIGAVGLFLFHFFYIKDVIYSLIMVGVAIIFLFIPIINYLVGLRQAKFFYAIVIPLWYSVTQLLVGGYFGQDIAAGATALMVYLIFKEEATLRNIFVAHNLTFFTLSALYITFYDPIFGVKEYPFDELVAVFICLGGLFIIFLFYDSKLNNLISLLKKNNRQLEQQKEELQSFTYIASHDLKSPVRNIINFSGLIKSDIGKGKKENLDKYVNIIERSAFQMNDLIEGVLEISNIDNTTKPSNLKPIDLNEILNKVRDNLQEEMQPKKAIIQSENLPKILFNELEIRSLFQNIIQNGLKYNQSKIPTVLINITYHTNTFQIHFKDNGIGIPEQYQEQVFKLFKRLHNQKNYQGTGLGLGICKKIILKYDGAIRLQSEPDLSSTFSLVLPNIYLTGKNEEAKVKEPMTL